MTYEQIQSMHNALKAIGGMRVDENTNHAQLSALCIAIAQAELRKFCCGDAACYNESNGAECGAANAVPSRTISFEAMKSDMKLIPQPTPEQTEYFVDLVARHVPYGPKARIG